MFGLNDEAIQPKVLLG